MDDLASIGDGGSNVGDGGFGFGGGTGGEVDARGIVGGEVGDCLLSETCVACGDTFSLGNLLLVAIDILPPVTRMTLPSKLPTSFSGLKLFPIAAVENQSLTSGTMKPSTTSSTVLENSRIPWSTYETNVAGLQDLAEYAVVNCPNILCRVECERPDVFMVVHCGCAFRSSRGRSRGRASDMTSTSRP